MAEFVIKRWNAYNADSVKNIRGCYKRGDIIEILVDGMADTMPHLTVIKVPGLPKKDVAFLKESLIDNSEISHQVLVRRKHYVSPAIMAKMFPPGVTNITIPLAKWDTWKVNIASKE